ncbi:MAG: insulinase family protein, partial [Planctomycetes bacterium]|nr:insulinase family protein [Planctomycetota bacterium]
MPQEISILTFPNGLTLLADRMSHVRSAAFNFLMPAGCVNDPLGKFGLSTILADLMVRGAGERDSRKLTEDLDRLGVDRAESVGSINMHFSGVTLSRNLLSTLTVYADILRRPRLPDEELEPAKALSLQDIQGLDDDPQSKVMVELSKRHYPAPLNRDRRGTAKGIENITIDDVKSHYANLFHPTGMVLSIAGDFDWEQLQSHVRQLFGDWAPRERVPLTIKTNRAGSGHLQKDIEQTQIALAYPSVPIGNDDFYNARGAVAVLSLDMSSRLFTNVREKHGLCYSVYASYETFKDRASIVAYAGAKPELAQETLDRTLHELRTLKDGIEEDELDRVNVGLKASLIMRQESTSARASSLSGDWYFLGRIRT